MLILAAPRESGDSQLVVTRLESGDRSETIIVALQKYRGGEKRDSHFSFQPPRIHPYLRMEVTLIPGVVSF